MEQRNQREDTHDEMAGSKKVHFSEARVAEFKVRIAFTLVYHSSHLSQKFSREDDVYSRLVESFAPSIWEMDDVKRGILCQLFGGTVQGGLAPGSGQRDMDRNSDLMQQNHDDFFLSQGKEAEWGLAGDDKASLAVSDDEDKSHHRSDVNVLLIGDPGTSKSQLLSYVHKVTVVLKCALCSCLTYFLPDYSTWHLHKRKREFCCRFNGFGCSVRLFSGVAISSIPPKFPLFFICSDPETRDFVLESGVSQVADNVSHPQFICACVCMCGTLCIRSCIRSAGAF